MVRLRLSNSLFVLAALMVAGPAAAQFGSIFNEPPPRPPADVPSAPPPPDRLAPPPYYPSRAAPPQRADQPPAAPLPAPMSLPPSSRPNRGTIQQQELPPPPGAQQAIKPPAQTQPDGAAIQTLPGLPPGQRQPRGTPQQGQQPAAAPAEPSQNEVVVEPPPQRIANPTAVFSGLDKITGRITSFDVAVNETVQFGALQVTPRVCYSRPPTETPQTDSFVEVDEVTLQGAIKRIFTGWMFAASPGLHAVEHPIYDVWLTDCKGGKLPAVAEVPQDQPPAKPVPPPRRAPRQQLRGFLPGLR
jgi:hypothetical protein